MLLLKDRDMTEEAIAAVTRRAVPFFRIALARAGALGLGLGLCGATGSIVLFSTALPPFGLEDYSNVPVRRAAPAATTGATEATLEFSAFHDGVCQLSRRFSELEADDPVRQAMPVKNSDVRPAPIANFREAAKGASAGGDYNSSRSFGHLIAERWAQRQRKSKERAETLKAAARA